MFGSNAANYNDYDFDGLANIDSTSFDPYQKINTHRQSDCFYRPGCTDQIMLNIGIILLLKD